MKKLLTFLFLSALVFDGAFAQKISKPNIVIIFLDNFGWGEPGFNGGGIIRGAATPRMDQIADEGLEALADSPYLQNLELLNANHNEIGDDGAIAIANTENLPNLKDLSMFGNVIGDRGAQAIADSPQSKKYTKLDLYKNQYTRKGYKALTESDNLKNCEELEVYRE